MTTQKNSDSDYRDTILKLTHPVKYLEKFSNSNVLIDLSGRIENGKKKLKYNSVDFIIGKLLNKNNELINYVKKDSINLYIIGTFRNDFVPVFEVAKALSEFYLEMNVLPNLITISKNDFFKDLKGSTNKIRNGILIYDRKRNLY